MSDPAPTALPMLLGAFGEDWCVRPAMLGPPDRVAKHQMQWLITPGPPISCYLAYMMPPVDPTSAMFYHLHPNTWSVHVVLSGSGKHCVDDHVNEVGPGTVIYQGPGVRHSLYPNPGSHLMQVGVQYLAAGHGEKEMILCPEVGTPDRYGDPEAFQERFGTVEQFVKNHIAEVFASDRWDEYVRRRRAAVK